MKVRSQCINTWINLSKKGILNCGMPEVGYNKATVTNIVYKIAKRSRFLRPNKFFISGIIK